MRFYVLENGLRSAAGHHLNNSIGLSQALAARGIQSRFLANTKARGVALGALDVTPCIRFSPYDHVSNDPVCGFLEDFFYQAVSIASDMVAVVGEHLCAEDFFLVPTTTHIELYACALMLEQLPVERRPHLVLNFMKENFLAAGSFKQGEMAPLYRFALKAMARNCPKDRALLCANSEAMTTSLGMVLGAGIELFPIPKVYPESLLRSKPIGAETRPFLVGIFGDMTAYKGFSLIPELVRLNPGLRWSIQIPKDGKLDAWEQNANWMLNHPDITLASGGLEPGAYYEMFSAADIVLTPYDPAFKRLQTSGVFAEAVASGKIVVAPESAWIMEHHRQGNWSGVTFDRQEVDSISEALQRAIRNWRDYAEAAACLAPIWRKNQSVHAFVDGVAMHFELCKKGVPA